MIIKELGCAEWRRFIKGLSTPYKLDVYELNNDKIKRVIVDNVIYMNKTIA
jgi:hypothetical protein